MSARSISPVVCWPWRLRVPGHAYKGATCVYCGMDIALLPADARGCCLYCGLDRGLTPAVDEPLHEGPYPGGCPETVNEGNLNFSASWMT